jgi:hypothetical protein
MPIGSSFDGFLDEEGIREEVKLKAMSYLLSRLNTASNQEQPYQNLLAIVDSIAFKGMPKEDILSHLYSLYDNISDDDEMGDLIQDIEVGKQKLPSPELEND